MNAHSIVHNGQTQYSPIDSSMPFDAFLFFETFICIITILQLPNIFVQFRRVLCVCLCVCDAIFSITTTSASQGCIFYEVRDFYEQTKIALSKARTREKNKKRVFHYINRIIYSFGNDDHDDNVRAKYYSPQDITVLYAF